VTDTRRTDGQTDGRTPHDSIGRAYAGIARQNGALYKWNRAKWQLNAHCIICKAKKQESSLRLIQTARIVHQPRQSETRVLTEINTDSQDSTSAETVRIANLPEIARLSFRQEMPDVSYTNNPDSTSAETVRIANLS